jgi:hypothetical protein
MKTVYANEGREGERERKKEVTYCSPEDPRV